VLDLVARRLVPTSNQRLVARLPATDPAA
jgi:hypothetical protein